MCNGSLKCQVGIEWPCSVQKIWTVDCVWADHVLCICDPIMGLVDPMLFKWKKKKGTKMCESINWKNPYKKTVYRITQTAQSPHLKGELKPHTKTKRKNIMNRVSFQHTSAYPVAIMLKALTQRTTNILHNIKKDNTTEQKQGNSNGRHVIHSLSESQFWRIFTACPDVQSWAAHCLCRTHCTHVSTPRRAPHTHPTETLIFIWGGLLLLSLSSLNFACWCLQWAMDRQIRGVQVVGAMGRGEMTPSQPCSLLKL